MIRNGTIALKNDDEHPLDEPLGVIHEMAIQLQILGRRDLAMQLAKAHEQIQSWVLTTIND